MLKVMGGEAWWSVPSAVALGVPMYTNAAGGHPDCRSAFGQGRGAGHDAGVYDVGHRAVAAWDDHFEAGSDLAAHRDFYCRRGGWDPCDGLSF